MRRLLVIALFALALDAQARVVRLDVATRNDLSNGYEKITGRVTYALDPANPHNRIIADLDKAPRDEHGEVTFSGDVVILRPKAGGNDTLYLEVPNRGGLGSFSNPEWDPALFRRGYTMAWVAWQFDVRDDPKLLHFAAPVVRGIRGPVRVDFIVDDPQPTHTIAHEIVAPYGHERMDTIGGTGYPVADRNDRANVLTEREAVEAPRRIIPRTKWHFTDDLTIALDGGFVPGKIYELVYTAANPAVAGTGLAALRDFAAWARHDPSSIIPVKNAYALGISQTGRLLRHFVYEGFNADENGRQVLDGVIAYVAGAGRGNFNHRFAQPSRATIPPAPALDPVDVYPFTDRPVTDPVTGRTEGLLDRATAEKVVPKIFYINTSYEYWSRGGSLIHTTPDGRSDVALPPTSRLYVITGHSHLDGPFPPERASGGVNLQNPLNYYDFTVHAAIDNMDAWVKKGTEPPPSRYPHIADGTLVRADQLAMKNAPRAPYAPYRFTNEMPPRVTGTFTTLVPQVGADGNELAGLRLPFLTTPLATHTGWNPRDPKTGFPNDFDPFAGSLFPFDKATIAARYPTRELYLGHFTADSLQLIKDRYVATEDFYYMLDLASRFWEWAVSRNTPAPSGGE
jgi:hypothetical protein